MKTGTGTSGRIYFNIATYEEIYISTLAIVPEVATVERKISSYIIEEIGFTLEIQLNFQLQFLYLKKVS